MANEFRPIDISNLPDLLRIAEEVRATGKPHVLRRASEDIAVLMPITPDQRRADTAIDGPTSKRLKSRLLSLAGAWSDLDADRMIEELFKARHEAPPSAPIEA